jgi:hypothetical protein
MFRRRIQPITMADLKNVSPDHYPVPRDDEEGLTIQRDWTEEEERTAKWK